jgi:2-aminoadipate transaminase
MAETTPQQTTPEPEPERTAPVKTISFARGVPAPECLPVEELADCARAVLERDGKTILSYGSAAGYTPLRTYIGEWFGVHPGRVVITNGALQGFVLVARELARARKVLIEGPTYDRAIKILLESGASLGTLMLDDEGIVPSSIEDELRFDDNVAFLYTIPTFQNPSGRTMSAERRRQVVELSRTHNFQIVEDDPYGLVRYEGEPQPALFDLSDKRTIYSSSFSKTISPGLRVGWYILPEELAEEITEVAASTYITPVLLNQATAFEFISRGNFEPNLERVKGLLRLRRAGEAPLGLQVDEASGRVLRVARVPGRHRRDEGARAGGGCHLRRRSRLRRDAEHCAARLQLRLARGDRARDRADRRGALEGRGEAASGGSCGGRGHRQRAGDETCLLGRLERAPCRAEGRAGTVEVQRAEAVPAEVAVLAGVGLVGHRLSRLLELSLGVFRKGPQGEGDPTAAAVPVNGLPTRKTRSFRPIRAAGFSASPATGSRVLPVLVTPVESSSQG